MLLKGNILVIKKNSPDIDDPDRFIAVKVVGVENIRYICNLIGKD